MNNNNKRLRRIQSIVIFFVTLIPVFFYSFSPVLAYLPVRQSSWSGGYGQQVWNNSSKFNEQYNVKYQTPGELTISQKPDNWYDPAWKYRVRIEIDNTELEELSHFPVLVVLDHKQNIEYWKTIKETGADIRFTDEDGKTLIPHDTERWDQGGKSYIWVKIPQIKDHAKDYFYMYYGNPQAQSASNAKDVFDNKFVSVWHLNERQANGSGLSDATNPDNEATMVGFNDGVLSDGPGQIGNATVFDGHNDTLRVDNFPNNFDFNSSDGFTISSWVNINTSPSNTGSDSAFDILSNWRNVNIGGKSNHGLFFEATLGNRVLRCAYRNNGTNVFDIFTNNVSATLPKQQWLHVACAYNPKASTQNAKMFLNGNQEAATANATSTFAINNRPLWIGTLENRLDTLQYGRYFDGSIDEVRISKIARTQDWIRAEYKTGTNTYLTYGDEEIYGSELISSIFDAGYGNNWGYLSYVADEPAKVKIRTGNNMYLADAPDFETCNPVANKSDISSNNCVKDGHRYIQYQIILDESSSFKSISITDFLPHPVVKGISTVATTKSQPSNHITIEPFPSPAPRPSPSPQLPQSPNYLNSLRGFLNALFH